MKNRSKAFWNDHKEAIVTGVVVGATVATVGFIAAADIQEKNQIVDHVVSLDPETKEYWFDVRKRSGEVRSFKVDEINAGVKSIKAKIKDNQEAAA